MNILDFIINALPGGILRIAGIAMTPRIILMTDGQPTDSAGVEEVSQMYLLQLNACLKCLKSYTYSVEPLYSGHP